MKTVAVIDELHLFGGIRAGTYDGHLFLWPTTTGKGIENADVVDTHAYRSEFLRLGLDLVGWESLSEIDGTMHAHWTLFTLNNGTGGIDDWSGIAYAAHLIGDIEASEMARHVSFSLQAASLRLRDISQAYGWQCLHVVNSKTACGQRFGNIETFDLFVALHAFLTEACSARDYLAKFIARKVLSLPDPATIGTMSALHRRLKVGILPATALSQEVLKICDKRSADGWMARLGHFRDLIVHEAPISTFSESVYLVAKPITVGGLTLPSIYVGIRRDPFVNDGAFVDALVHFRWLMLQLLAFSRLVIASSPIRPQVRHFTDADLRN